MGFTNTGRHNSKDMSLWQQGNIRIVLNSDAKGHAATSFTDRRRNVCDIGLQVPSVTDTMARAKAFGLAPLGQARGDGELAISAIQGLGGSVLHFLDAKTEHVWDVEFSLHGKASDGVGLTQVDHIAQTMNYDEMLSWSLLYTSLFGMNKVPMLDVIDPDVLVRSQALSSDNGSFRITLNGAETPHTLAGGFLADSFGASVQHVAFAADNIFATAKALDRTGFEALPITANCYVDLAARFDIETETLEVMRSHDILYDRVADTEFFQLYSRPFAGSMFFEIVERRAGYDGFGAPNAAFRIASQKDWDA